MSTSREFCGPREFCGWPSARGLACPFSLLLCWHSQPEWEGNEACACTAVVGFCVVVLLFYFDSILALVIDSNSSAMSPAFSWPAMAGKTEPLQLPVQARTSLLSPIDQNNSSPLCSFGNNKSQESDPITLDVWFSMFIRWLGAHLSWMIRNQRSIKNKINRILILKMIEILKIVGFLKAVFLWSRRHR